MARKTVLDMLKEGPKGINPEQHCTLGAGLKWDGLLLAVAMNTDLNTVIRQSLNDAIQTYKTRHSGSWKALVAQHGVIEEKKGKRG